MVRALAFHSSPGSNPRGGSVWRIEFVVGSEKFFSRVLPMSLWGGALRDDAKNGCVVDKVFSGSISVRRSVG